MRLPLLGEISFSQLGKALRASKYNTLYYSLIPHTHIRRGK
jgi:hypothetical protein